MTPEPRSPAARAVVWDLGGVILRTMDSSRRSAWEDRLGLPRMQLTRLVFESDASRRATLGQASDDQVWEAVAAALSLDPATALQLRHDFFADDRVDARLMDFIRQLGRRLRVGMITNAWPGSTSRSGDDLRHRRCLRPTDRLGRGGRRQARPAHLPTHARALGPRAGTDHLRGRLRGQRDGGAVGWDAGRALHLDAAGDGGRARPP